MRPTCVMPLLLLLLLLMTVGQGFLFDDIGVIHPQGDIYLKVGDVLNMTCSLTGYETPLNATFMYFRHTVENRLIPDEYTEVRGERQLGLVVLNVTLSDSGWYFCLLNESSINGNEVTITQRSVVVSAPPRPVKSLRCVSDNYEDMTCDWCNETEYGVKYELHWSIGYTVRQGKCQILQDNCRCIFCWQKKGACTSKSQDFFHRNTYNMTITSILYGQKSTSNFLIATTFKDIVKPRPPTELSVSVINNTALTAKWKPPAGLENPEIFPLDYIVAYSAKNSWDDVGFHQEMVVVNRTSVNLTNLHPYTNYEVSVIATPGASKGYRSDPTTTQAQTAQSEPSAPPPLMPGSFKVYSENNGQRRVTVFWGAIPVPSQNGELTGFKVRYKSLKEEGPFNKLDVAPDQYAVSLTLDTNNSYQVWVQGRTVADGVASSIYVPQSSDVKKPHYEEGLLGENQTSVHFMIVPPDDSTVDNYTLLYCIGHVSNSVLNPRSCKNGIAPVILTYPGDSNQLTFNEHRSEYVYAVAVNYKDGGTSGLSPEWLSLCDYDGDPPKPVVYFPEGQKERSLTLEWDLQRCSQEVRGMVSHFELKLYQEEEVENFAVFNFTISAGYGDRMQKTIENLDPDTIYVFVLKACTALRCSQASTVQQRTLESAPSGPPVNVSVENQGNKVKFLWQPPTVPNGIITQYHIEIKSSDGNISKTITTNETTIMLTDLPGYVNYSVEIQAENSAGISNFSEPVTFFVPIKAPGRFTFEAEVTSVSVIRIKMSAPQPPNGPHPSFLLTSRYDGKERYYRVSAADAKQDIRLDCTGNEVVVNLSVVAVNELKNGTKLEGPASEVKTLSLCKEITGVQPSSLRYLGFLSIVVILIIVIVYFKIRNQPKLEKVIMPDNKEMELEIGVSDNTTTCTGYLKIDEKTAWSVHNSRDDSGVSDTDQSSQQTDVNDDHLFRVTSDEDNNSPKGSFSSTSHNSDPQVAGRIIITEYSRAGKKTDRPYEIISSGGQPMSSDNSQNTTDQMPTWCTSPEMNARPSGYSHSNMVSVDLPGSGVELNEDVSSEACTEPSRQIWLNENQSEDSNSSDDDDVDSTSAKNSAGLDGYQHGKVSNKEIQFIDPTAPSGAS